MTQEKVHDIIKKTCEENSWNVIEFKLDTLIAENIDGDNTKAVTIKFDKHTFSITPADSGLSNALEEALE